MKINARQFSIVIFYLLISLKFLALPSMIYNECKTDSWLVFIIMAVVDILLIWIIVSILRSSKEKNFYEFLKNRLGVVVTKIIFFACLIVLLLDIMKGVVGLQRLLLENFYSQLHWAVFLLPLLGVLSIMSYKGVRNIGRVGEIFIYLIIGGLIFIIFKGFSNFDPFFFLPILSNGGKVVISSTFQHISWFGTPLALLFLMGTIDFGKKSTALIWRYIGWTLLIGLSLIFIFYGSFGIMSGMHSFAFSDVSQISNASTALDEISWLVVSLWIIASVIQISILFYSSAVAFKYTFSINNNWLPIFVLNVLLIIYQNINLNSIDLKKMFYSTPVVNLSFCIKIVLVVAIFIFNIIYLKVKRKVKDVKT